MHAKLQLSIRCSFLFLRQSACFAQRFGDDPLQLAVGGAELVSSHASMALIVSESMRNIKLLVVVSFLAMLLMIQCTRIHHRLGGVVATEYYE